MHQLIQSHERKQTKQCKQLNAYCKQLGPTISLRATSCSPVQLHLLRDTANARADGFNANHMRLSPSKEIPGLQGGFALKDQPKGSNIGMYTGVVMTAAELDAFDDQFAHGMGIILNGVLSGSVGKEKVYLTGHPSNSACQLVHSMKANCVLTTKLGSSSATDVGRHGNALQWNTIVVQTNRMIWAGEELTVAYEGKKRTRFTSVPCEICLEAVEVDGRDSSQCSAWYTQPVIVGVGRADRLNEWPCLQWLHNACLSRHNISLRDPMCWLHFNLPHFHYYPPLNSDGSVIQPVESASYLLPAPASQSDTGHNHGAETSSHSDAAMAGTGEFRMPPGSVCLFSSGEDRFGEFDSRIRNSQRLSALSASLSTAVSTPPAFPSLFPSLFSHSDTHHGRTPIPGASPSPSLGLTRVKNVVGVDSGSSAFFSPAIYKAATAPSPVSATPPAAANLDMHRTPGLLTSSELVRRLSSDAAVLSSPPLTQPATDALTSDHWALSVLPTAATAASSSPSLSSPQTTRASGHRAVSKAAALGLSPAASTSDSLVPPARTSSFTIGGSAPPSRSLSKTLSSLTVTTLAPPAPAAIPQAVSLPLAANAFPAQDEWVQLAFARFTSYKWLTRFLQFWLSNKASAATPWFSYHWAMERPARPGPGADTISVISSHDKALYRSWVDGLAGSEPSAIWQQCDEATSYRSVVSLLDECMALSPAERICIDAWLQQYMCEYSWSAQQNDNVVRPGPPPPTRRIQPAHPDPRLLHSIRRLFEEAKEAMVHEKVQDDKRRAVQRRVCDQYTHEISSRRDTQKQSLLVDGVVDYGVWEDDEVEHSVAMPAVVLAELNSVFLLVQADINAALSQQIGSCLGMMHLLEYEWLQEATDRLSSMIETQPWSHFVDDQLNGLLEEIKGMRWNSEELGRRYKTESGHFWQHVVDRGGEALESMPTKERQRRDLIVALVISQYNSFLRPPPSPITPTATPSQPARGSTSSHNASALISPSGLSSSSSLASVLAQPAPATVTASAATAQLLSSAVQAGAITRHAESGGVTTLQAGHYDYDELIRTHHAYFPLPSSSPPPPATTRISPPQHRNRVSQPSSAQPMTCSPGGVEAHSDDWDAHGGRVGKEEDAAVSEDENDASITEVNSRFTDRSSQIHERRADGEDDCDSSSEYVASDASSSSSSSSSCTGFESNCSSGQLPSSDSEPDVLRSRRTAMSSGDSKRTDASSIGGVGKQDMTVMATDNTPTLPSAIAPSSALPLLPPPPASHLPSHVSASPGLSKKSQLQLIAAQVQHYEMEEKALGLRGEEEAVRKRERKVERHVNKGSKQAIRLKLRRERAARRGSDHCHRQACDIPTFLRDRTALQRCCLGSEGVARLRADLRSSSDVVMFESRMVQLETLSADVVALYKMRLSSSSHRKSPNARRADFFAEYASKLPASALSVAVDEEESTQPLDNAAILRIIHLHHQGLALCQQCFCLIHNMSASTLKDWVSMLRSGARDGKHGNAHRKRMSGLALKTANASLVIDGMVQTTADAAPDANVTTLPQRTYPQLLEGVNAQLSAQMGSAATVSMTTLMKAVRHKGDKVKLSGKHPTLPKCSTCVDYDNRKAAGSHLITEEEKSEYQLHLNIQQAEREVAMAHTQQASALPSEYLCLAIDGMDQGKTAFPHVQQQAKWLTEDFVRCPVHLTGVMAWGPEQTYAYLNRDHIRSCPSLTIDILMDVLRKILALIDDQVTGRQPLQRPQQRRLDVVASAVVDNSPSVVAAASLPVPAASVVGQQRQQKFTTRPHTLYLHMDNSGKDNKNAAVMFFLAMLVQRGIFKSIQVHFLIVGHTHDRVDQFFSCISRRLNVQDVWTFSELRCVVEQSFTRHDAGGAGDKFEADLTLDPLCRRTPTVIEILRMAAWSEFILSAKHQDSTGLPGFKESSIHGIKEPHCFRIEKQQGGGDAVVMCTRMFTHVHAIDKDPSGGRPRFRRHERQWSLPQVIIPATKTVPWKDPCLYPCYPANIEGLRASIRTMADKAQASFTPARQAEWDDALRLQLDIESEQCVNCQSMRQQLSDIHPLASSKRKRLTEARKEAEKEKDREKQRIIVLLKRHMETGHPPMPGAWTDPIATCAGCIDPVQLLIPGRVSSREAEADAERRSAEKEEAVRAGKRALLEQLRNDATVSGGKQRYAIALGNKSVDAGVNVGQLLWDGQDRSKAMKVGQIIALRLNNYEWPEYPVSLAVVHTVTPARPPPRKRKQKPRNSAAAAAQKRSRARQPTVAVSDRDEDERDEKDEKEEKEEEEDVEEKKETDEKEERNHAEEKAERERDGKTVLGVEYLYIVYPSVLYACKLMDQKVERRLKRSGNRLGVIKALLDFEALSQPGGLAHRVRIGEDMRDVGDVSGFDHKNDSGDDVEDAAEAVSSDESEFIQGNNSSIQLDASARHAQHAVLRQRRMEQRRMTNRRAATSHGASDSATAYIPALSSASASSTSSSSSPSSSSSASPRSSPASAPAPAPVAAAPMRPLTPLPWHGRFSSWYIRDGGGCRAAVRVGPHTWHEEFQKVNDLFVDRDCKPSPEVMKQLRPLLYLSDFMEPHGLQMKALDTLQGGRKGKAGRQTRVMQEVFKEEVLCWDDANHVLDNNNRMWATYVVKLKAVLEELDGFYGDDHISEADPEATQQQSRKAAAASGDRHAMEVEGAGGATGGGSALSASNRMTLSSAVPMDNSESVAPNVLARDVDADFTDHSLVNTSLPTSSSSSPPSIYHSPVCRPPPPMSSTSGATVTNEVMVMEELDQQGRQQQHQPELSGGQDEVSDSQRDLSPDSEESYSYPYPCT